MTPYEQGYLAVLTKLGMQGIPPTGLQGQGPLFRGGTTRPVPQFRSSNTGIGAKPPPAPGTNVSAPPALTGQQKSFTPQIK